MQKTWVVVVQRQCARLYEQVEGSARLRSLGMLARDDRHRPSGRPEDSELRAFSRRIAELLAVSERTFRYDRLILVAETALLGPIRLSLAPRTSARVAASINTPPSYLDERSLVERIAAFLPGAPTPPRQRTRFAGARAVSI